MSSRLFRAKHALSVGVRRGVNTLVVRPDALCEYPLLLHFAYHKCMTSYFSTIVHALAAEFGFVQQHFKANAQAFEERARTAGETGLSLFSVNNRHGFDFSAYPDFRGSHIVRDPRDLIVSAYRYHLWTPERWCNDPAYDWSRLIGHPQFVEEVEPDAARHPSRVSYREYLNSLDPERGLILELLRHRFVFRSMQAWDYANPHIVEMRYEDIVGAEGAAFERLFQHYGMHPRMIRRGVELAENLSLKNQDTGEGKHARSGKPQQWQHEFTPRVRILFKRLYPTLLVDLGYELRQDW